MRDRGFGNRQQVRITNTHRPSFHIMNNSKHEALLKISVCFSNRGSPFLKRWMEFLEENADLRYPNAADLM